MLSNEDWLFENIVHGEREIVSSNGKESLDLSLLRDTSYEDSRTSARTRRWSELKARN
jgi:hypothetical protein